MKLRPHVLEKKNAFCFPLEKSPSSTLTINSDCAGIVKPRGGVKMSGLLLRVVLEIVLSAAEEQVPSEKKLNSALKGK